jgi:fructan beta-fructosidase
MKRKVLVYFIGMLIITGSCIGQPADTAMREEYRPKAHFTPTAHWINDPNGMVYYKGIYHLFFQYYPDSTIWGPMHWGHATSTDLIHWKEQPIALYPDSLGYIFSGSAVVDKNNTSGLGENGKIPLIALFTSHNPVTEREHRMDYENQSMAYSLDDGKTWKKYEHNPVLRNPGITDFRDPKVMWYEPEKKWIMTLATKNRVTFYSSKNLKDWKRESDFGENIGAHGGVWECPDLFPLDDNGKNVWVLIANINPGGPNLGSGTQYFLGSFDGNKFTTNQTETKWLDYGPDDYAGITWSNTGSRKIFLGWMSNWLYANLVPTIKWRNAMTIPRELKIQHLGKDIFVASQPVKELNEIKEKPIVAENVEVNKSIDITKRIKDLKFPCQFNMATNSLKDFSIVLSNDIGEQLVIGYNKKNNQYYIDRTKSGKTGFQKDFAAKHTSPRFAKNQTMNLSLVIDVSSIELFADDGLTVMTAIFFPDKPFNKMVIDSNDKLVIGKWSYAKYKSIWN